MFDYSLFFKFQLELVWVIDSLSCSNSGFLRSHAVPISRPWFRFCTCFIMAKNLCMLAPGHYKRNLVLFFCSIRRNHKVSKIILILLHRCPWLRSLSYFALSEWWVLHPRDARNVSCLTLPEPEAVAPKDRSHHRAWYLKRRKINCAMWFATLSYPLVN